MGIKISSIPPLTNEVLHYQSPSCQLEGDTTVYTVCFASLLGLHWFVSLWLWGKQYPTYLQGLLVKASQHKTNVAFLLMQWHQFPCRESGCTQQSCGN